MHASMLRKIHCDFIAMHVAILELVVWNVTSRSRIAPIGCIDHEYEIIQLYNNLYILCIGYICMTIIMYNIICMYIY